MALKLLRPKIREASLTKVKPRRTEGGGARDFYQSPEWRALKASVIAERGRVCEGIDVPAHGVPTTERLHCDHRIELADGGAKLDPANIVLLCVPCHNRKTAASARKRYTGV